MEELAQTPELKQAIAERTDRELLEYVAAMLSRLEPLIEALEGAGPALASMMPDANGNKPSPFKMAMGAAKLARGK